MRDKLSPYLDIILKNIGGYFRISKKGVPHIVLERPEMTYSICWFKKRKKYRLFYPYPSYDKKQEKRDFTNITNLQQFLLKKNV